MLIWRMRPRVHNTTSVHLLFCNVFWREQCASSSVSTSCCSSFCWKNITNSYSLSENGVTFFAKFFLFHQYINILDIWWCWKIWFLSPYISKTRILLIYSFSFMYRSQSAEWKIYFCCHYDRKMEIFSKVFFFWMTFNCFWKLKQNNSSTRNVYSSSSEIRMSGCWGYCCCLSAHEFLIGNT